MVAGFSDLIQKREITPELIDAYHETLKGYSDKEVKEAGFKCLDECLFFPKISEIKKFLKGVASGKGLHKRFTCPRCNNYVTCIVEGECWDCHNGVPLSAGRVPFVDNFKETVRDYAMQDRMMCQECGKVSHCIKEPISSGKWQCNQCYTGMTASEFKARMRKLISQMGNSGITEKELNVPIDEIPDSDIPF